MRSNRIYTRKTLGFDNRVWFTMIGMVVLIEGFFVYNALNPGKCTPFTFQTSALDNDSVFITGKKISFIASIDNNNIAWDFGDKTNQQFGSIEEHTFYQEGKFDVKASINSKCGYEKRITVIMPEAPKSVKVKILGPDSTETGKEISFSYSSPTVDTTYEWVVSGYPGLIIKNKESVAKVNFSTPGTYNIVVTLDNDNNKVGTKTINVKRKQVAGPVISDKPSCTLPIPLEVFSENLKNVMNNSSSSSKFSPYLCKGDATPVYIISTKNKLRKTFQFGDFCLRLANIKAKDKPRIKITVLEITPDSDPKAGVAGLKISVLMSWKNVNKKVDWYDYEDL